jgi:hypothetical protein
VFNMRRIYQTSGILSSERIQSRLVPPGIRVYNGASNIIEAEGCGSPHPGHSDGKETIKSVKGLPGGFLSLIGSTNPRENSRHFIAALLVLVVWLSAVVFTETRHEFWRDEVRAVSLARAADSPAELYRSVQDDGHPLLWYLILFAGKSIVDSPVVLPVLAIAIGFLAVAVFLYFAPFPFWFKCLFLFSAIPFYEYSVMARNYGISMLLLFLFALFYKQRDRLGLLLVVVLVLLANTNAHSVVFAAALAGVWAWDLLIERRAALTRGKAIAFAVGMLVLAAGIAASILSFMPRGDTILSPIRQTLNIENILDAVGKTALHPEVAFDRMVPAWVPPAAVAAVFFGVILGLVGRFPIFLAAVLADLVFGLLFQLVYPGYFRHQGLFLVFAICLYWLAVETRGNETGLKIFRLMFAAGAYVALPILFLAGIIQLRETAWLDIRMERSSSKVFGGFLQSNPDYRDAILLPEPDYLIESAAYYADNEIYLPREGRFSKTVSWTTDSNAFLSLAELLSTARRLRDTYGKPVLIVMGHTQLDFIQPAAGRYKYSYNKVFTWDAQSGADFHRSTVLVADFHDAMEDENYRVYLLLEETDAAVIACVKNGHRSMDGFFQWKNSLCPRTPVCLRGFDLFGGLFLF